MRDPALEGYVAAIEAHLGRRRGADHVLSPGDFALARRWFEGGIAVEEVIRAIDAVAATGRAPNGLAVCRRHVEARPARAPRRRSRAEPPDVAREADRLDPLERALEALPPDARDAFADAARTLRDLRNGERDAAWEAALDAADGRLTAIAVAALPDEERLAILDEAGRAARRQAGRVAPEALEQARRRHLERRARERWGLPPSAAGGSGRP